MPKEDYYNETALPFHPFKIYLFFLLAGITALFLGATGAYLYTRVQTGMTPIAVPPIFFCNTLVLLSSSLTLHWANRAYLRDNTRQYQYALAATLALTLLFMTLQYVGWQVLVARNAAMTTGPGAAYIHAISILHFLHILGGLPFLCLFFGTAILRMREPVSVLVYFADPAKLLKLNLLTTYWHYLDALWVYLVLFFSLNALFVL